jgi:serine/threonine protein kinase
MQNLNHTNLVKMIDSFTAKIDGWERVYIILEFCNGGDLENYL